MAASNNTTAENLKRLRQLTRKNDLLLAKTLLQLEDLHSLNENLKATMMRISKRAAENGNHETEVIPTQVSPRTRKKR